MNGNDWHILVCDWERILQNSLIRIVILDFNSVRQKVWKKRRNPSNVEEVELQEHRCMEEMHEDVESHFLGRRQSSDSEEYDVLPNDVLPNSVPDTWSYDGDGYELPLNCAGRFADTTSDDGYARPYDHWPLLRRETNRQAGTQFPGRCHTSLAERPLPALPHRSINSVYRKPPIPTPRVQIDTRLNHHSLLPATNYDSDTSDSTNVTQTGFTGSNAPHPVLSTDDYDDTLWLHGETFHISHSNVTPSSTSVFVKHSHDDDEQCESYECEENGENPSKTENEIHYRKLNGHHAVQDSGFSPDGDANREQAPCLLKRHPKRHRQNKEIWTLQGRAHAGRAPDCISHCQVSSRSLIAMTHFG